MNTGNRPTIASLIPVKLPSLEERKRLRFASGLTGAQFAATIGVSSATVYAWERGDREPTGLQRDAYAVGLLELAELVDGQ